MLRNAEEFASGRLNGSEAHRPIVRVSLNGVDWAARRDGGAMAFDDELARRVRRVLDEHAAVTEKHMFGGIAFMVHDNMSVGIVGDVLMVRTGPDAYESLLDEPHARPMDFTGRPMRGFVFVDAAGIATAKDLRRWIGLGVSFAQSLPKRKRRSRPASGVTR